MEPIKQLWKNAVGATNEGFFEYGRLGKLAADGSEEISVPGRPHFVYVREGVGETTGYIEAQNEGAPNQYGIRVRYRKMGGIHIIDAIDYTSGTLTENQFNVAPHHHGPTSGLGRADDGARVYSVAEQSITTATTTEVIFPALRIDENGYWDAGLNTRLTAPATGWYAISANLSFAANATGYRQLILRRSTTLILAQDTRQAVTEASIVTTLQASTVAHFLADQYVVCEVYQTSGGALNVLTPEFAMARIG